jgi:Ca-activated chloride channel homolog
VGGDSAPEARAARYGLDVPSDRAIARTERAMTGASGKRRRRGFRWRKHLAILLLAGSVVCVVAALAQFSVGRRVSDATVVLVMDASRSMRRSDVQPDRFTAARDAAQSFLDRVPTGFDVGLVTFTGTADRVVDPTSQRADVAGALRDVSAASGNGTVVGDGLSAALDDIEVDRRRTGTRPAAVVLLSDGSDTGSHVSPDAAAGRAKDMEVPVFTVAITATGSDASAGEAGGIALLHRIAAATDGRTYTAATAGELNQVYASLGSRLSYDLAISNFGAAFLVAATVLAIAAGAAAVLASRRRY